MSWVLLKSEPAQASSASPLDCSKATSNGWKYTVPALPTSLVTVQLGVHTYASSHWSSPWVTTIDVSESIGDRALRTMRTGEARVRLFNLRAPAGPVPRSGFQPVASLRPWLGPFRTSAT